MLVLCDHEQATATLPADLDGVLSQEAGSARLALRHLEDALPAPAPRARHRPDRRRVARDAEGTARVRRDVRPGPGAAGRAGPVDQPRVGAVGDAVLRGGALPRPGRHARPARRGLGRAGGHRPRRPHHGDHEHRRRADPRPRAAHGPVLAREGRADLERGLRQRGPPQGRQRLGPVRPQARRASSASTSRATWSPVSRTSTTTSRRTPRRRSPTSTPSTPGCSPAPSTARPSARPGPSARRTPTRSCTPSGSPRARRASPSPGRRRWCCTPTPCFCATGDRRRGGRTSPSPSAWCSPRWPSC